MPATPRPRRRRRTLAAAALAALLLLVLLDQLGVRRLSGHDFPLRDPLAPALRAHVERLADPAWAGRVPGTPGNDAAARWLAAALEAAGVAPLPSLGGYLAPLPPAPGGAPLGHNVLGWLPGEAQGGAIVLGAHFDHMGQTKDGLLLGADDNASAVAVLLGALPALRARPLRRPVVIVFFNTEESPYFGSALQGSRVFARALPPEVGDLASIRLAVVLDLIGGVVWRHTADTVFACGAEKSPGLPQLVDAVSEDGLDVRRLGVHMVENLPGYQPQPFSDYDVFRDHRVPFLFLSSGRTPRYHTAADLPGTLHYDRMARTARWIARLVAAVDARDAPFAFDPEAEDFPADVASIRWAIDEAASPLGWVPGTGPITAFRLRADRARLEALSAPGAPFARDDVLALEHAGFRLQCLLYSFPVCFTF